MDTWLRVILLMTLYAFALRLRRTSCCLHEFRFADTEVPARRSFNEGEMLNPMLFSCQRSGFTPLVCRAERDQSAGVKGGRPRRSTMFAGPPTSVTRRASALMVAPEGDAQSHALHGELLRHLGAVVDAHRHARGKGSGLDSGGVRLASRSG